MGVSDLKVSVRSRPSVHKEGEHVHGHDDFFSGDAASSLASFSSHCSALRRRLQGQVVPLCRPLPGHGLCTVDLSRELARYRSLPTGHEIQALPHGHSLHGLPQQSVQCQREARLAHLCRVCPSAYRRSAPPVHRRGPGSRPERDRLCLGLHDHRPVPLGLPLGALPPYQGGDQTAYLAQPARRHSRVRSDLGRKTARCPRLGPPDSLSRCLLHHGSRIPGFRAPVPTPFCPVVIRDPRQRPTSSSAAATPTRWTERRD